MTFSARPLALTALLAALAQVWLWTDRGGPLAGRLALLAGALAALLWAALSRGRRNAALDLLATLAACGAFWLGALEVALLSHVVMARGFLLLLTLASLHASLVFSALRSVAPALVAPTPGSPTPGAPTPGAPTPGARAGLRLLVSVTIVLATFTVLEAAARALSPLRSYELIPDEPAAGPCLVRASDGRLEGVPGCTGHYLHRDFAGVRAEFNALGLRDGPDDAAPPAAEELGILVLGDSFAYGMGVELPQSFQQLLAESLLESGHQTRVYGAAMPGAGTIHQRWVLEELGPRLAPEVVVVALFQDNDLQENWQAANRGEVAPAPPRLGPPTPWRFLASTAGVPFWRTTSSLLQLRRIDGRPTAVLEAAMRQPPAPEVAPMRAAVVDELLAIDTTTRGLGAELVVLLIPAIVQAETETFDSFTARHPEHTYNRTGFHQALSADLVSLGVRVVDPLPRLEASARANQACYHREGHWNARGHEIAAELLAERLQPLLRERQDDEAVSPGRPPASPG